MNDRSNNPNENATSTQDPRKHDQSPWVKKYLDLADTALEQREEPEFERAA